MVSTQLRSPIASVLVSPRLRAAASNSAGPLSRSLTTISSPGSSPATSNSVIIRGRTKTGSPPGRKNAPATQPCAYSDWPNVGMIRSTPVRYSRSEEGARKEEVDAGLVDIRSPSLRLRSE